MVEILCKIVDELNIDSFMWLVEHSEMLVSDVEPTASKWQQHTDP